MHTVDTKDLKPGMITADRVLSKHGQLIVEKDKLLTIQMISHIEFYGIVTVKILDGELPARTIVDMAAEKEIMTTYTEKIKSSKEFIDFKANYEKKLDFLENNISDFITKNTPFNKDVLLEQILDLFVNNMTTISMFDMLHNLGSINNTTYAHCMNVAIISRMIGMWTNFSKEDLDILTLGGLLHDIGKCIIPDSIISKPARLTPSEFEEIKNHPRFGYEILKNQNVPTSVKNIALNHHERCDGKGYPKGLKSEEIDDYSVIIAIADVYDAMTANRSYRSGLCPFEVIATFEREGLNKYKPQYIMSFLERIANTYINNGVLLSNGDIGTIVLINKQHLTRPIVQLDNRRFVNLEKHPELYIQAII